MRKWKGLGLTLLAVMGLMALTACGSKKSGLESTEEKGLTKMDIVLDWYPNAIHTFLYDAQEKGYFAEEGLEVNLIPPAETVDALTFVSTGKAQIGFTYPVEVVKSAQSGMKVRAIGAVTQRNLGVFTALKESGVSSDFTTLKGRKIGYDGTANSEAVIRTAAAKAGLTEKDYELVNVGFDLTTALITKSVDLTSGMMLNDEVVTMRNEGYDVESWAYSDYGVPEMYDIVMVVKEDDYQDHTEMYQSFLRACNKGFQDMKASKKDSMELIMEKMNSDENPLDQKQQEESYEILLPYMETEEEPFLTMKDDKWQKIIDWMKDSKLIDKDVKPSDIMTSPDFK